MIVATAGHVDHGKTSLIRALTSVDTDRLPEERKRGMTIDLGFAYLPVEAAPGQPPVDSIGFIDVPGHERFVRNLLCGLSGIDLAVLVIAADDGPMPQTAEHLSILDLLEVPGGVVVMTRIDRVSDARIAQVRALIETMCAGTALSGVPIFPVSCLDGRGIDALKEHLLSAARSSALRSRRGTFRLAIDRVFNVAGTGLIVTGTAASGSVQVGNSVRAPDGTSLRVRSLHVNNRPAESGQAGQRCALNLSGPGDVAASIARGDWIVAPQAPLPTARWDARVRILGSVPKPVANGTPVSVHLGTAHANARISWLEARTVDTGASAFAQLMLEHPIGAAHGDRFIVRDPSSRRTIGGGQVIDIFAPARGRTKPERLAYLSAMAVHNDATALARLLDVCVGGLPLRQFRANRNLAEDEAQELFARVQMERIATSDGPIGFSPARWSSVERQAIESVAKWHLDSPCTIGMPEDRILDSHAPRVSRPLAIGIARELALRGRLVRTSGTVRLPTHRPTIDPAQEAMWRKLAPHIERRPLRPPSLHELAALLDEPTEYVESALEHSARLGRIVRVSSRHYYVPSALRRLGEVVCAVAQDDANGEVSAMAFRDRSGIGRNVSIEVLEFFDRKRFTRRYGNTRRLVRTLEDVLGEDEPRRM
ncbi:MAG: selenocysteine-specific translation elongation factor [Burkholderiaceae bacterium]|nr:selenocysteine-specific translation elongation factor [Burkholderiaceae bacterium]